MERHVSDSNANLPKAFRPRESAERPTIKPLRQTLMTASQIACDECGSTFNRAASEMSALCPECAHVLYGSPNCPHVFADGRCIRCAWDGSVSAYVESLRRAGAQSQSQDPPSEQE